MVKNVQLVLWAMEIHGGVSTDKRFSSNLPFEKQDVQTRAGGFSHKAFGTLMFFFPSILF